MENSDLPSTSPAKCSMKYPTDFSLHVVKEKRPAIQAEVAVVVASFPADHYTAGDATHGTTATSDTQTGAAEVSQNQQTTSTTALLTPRIRTQ